MAGFIALVGGDEFSDGCVDMDRAILETVGVPHPSLLVVPTAAAYENPTAAASNGVEYFSGLGARASALMVLDAGQANDEGFLSPVDAAHVIYLTGGNPAHLLDTLAGSVLLQKLRRAHDRGAVLAGSSAGAMVMGSWMRFRGWRKALGIVPHVATLPHHERSDPDVVAEDLARSGPEGVTVLGIDAETGCFGGPDGWKVLGAGSVTVYQGGQWRRYASGAALPVAPESTGSPR